MGSNSLWIILNSKNRMQIWLLGDFLLFMQCKMNKIRVLRDPLLAKNLNLIAFQHCPMVCATPILVMGSVTGQPGFISGCCPNLFTTPILAMGYRQWLPLSVVQLKGKHCRKPHCCNGVVDTFEPYRPMDFLLSWPQLFLFKSPSTHCAALCSSRV